MFTACRIFIFSGTAPHRAMPFSAPTASTSRSPEMNGTGPTAGTFRCTHREVVSCPSEPAERLENGACGTCRMSRAADATSPHFEHFEPASRVRRLCDFEEERAFVGGAGFTGAVLMT